MFPFSLESPLKFGRVASFLLCFFLPENCKQRMNINNDEIGDCDDKNDPDYK